MSRRKFYVARLGDKFAAYGHETGMGRALDLSANVGDREVIKAETPDGLMRQIGGHCVGYEAVPVEEVVERVYGAPEPWPDPKEVWD